MKDLINLSNKLGKLLLQKGLFITTAESCTGGWVSQEITAIPGSSRWFGASFVTYSNESKQEVLGVNNKTLKAFGAVSNEVVEEMTSGALQKSKADLSIGISGIAGPTGATKDRPIGMVCISWQLKGKKVISSTELFKGDRTSVRYQTVERALEGAINLLKSL